MRHLYGVGDKMVDKIITIVYEHYRINSQSLQLKAIYNDTNIQPEIDSNSLPVILNNYKNE